MAFTLTTSSPDLTTPRRPAPGDQRRAALDYVAVRAAADQCKPVREVVESQLGDRLEAANENGEAIRAFTSQRADTADVTVATFPWWIASNSVATSSSGTAAGVTGAGAGGGGGAAGST